jgi:hypothetical protein
VSTISWLIGVLGRDFEATLAQTGLHLLRPAREGEPERAGARCFKPLRQVIESINDTFKGPLDLEAHGGHTRPASSSASGNASSRSPPRSGTTTTSAPQSSDPLTACDH